MGAASAVAWTATKDPAAADITGPVISEPVVPSARIAGMIRDRLMRMVPPWRFPRPAAPLHRYANLHGVYAACGGVSHHLVISCQYQYTENRSSLLHEIF
jgi:hypothetical protein